MRLAGCVYYSKIGGKIAAKSVRRDFARLWCGRNRDGCAADKVKRADEAKYRSGVVTPKGILVRKPRWNFTAKGIVEVA